MCKNLTAISFIVLELWVTKVEKSDVCNRRVFANPVTYKVCAHTIPTAETTGKLQDFMLWLIKQKCAPNLSHLALHGIPKGAGEKGGIPKITHKQKQQQQKLLSEL